MPTSLLDYTSRSDLVQLFHLQMKDAAEKLNVSESSLRSVCRKYNISRWPYRKFQQVDSHLAHLRSDMEHLLKGAEERGNDSNSSSSSSSSNETGKELLHSEESIVIHLSHIKSPIALEEITKLQETIDTLTRARKIMEENPNLSLELAIIEANTRSKRNENIPISSSSSPEPKVDHIHKHKDKTKNKTKTKKIGSRKRKMSESSSPIPLSKLRAVVPHGQSNPLLRSHENNERSTESQHGTNPEVVQMVFRDGLTPQASHSAATSLLHAHHFQSYPITQLRPTVHDLSESRSSFGSSFESFLYDEPMESPGTSTTNFQTVLGINASMGKHEADLLQLHHNNVGPLFALPPPPHRFHNRAPQMHTLTSSQGSSSWNPYGLPPTTHNHHVNGDQQVQTSANQQGRPYMPLPQQPGPQQGYL